MTPTPEGFINTSAIWQPEPELVEEELPEAEEDVTESTD